MSGAASSGEASTLIERLLRQLNEHTAANQELKRGKQELQLELKEAYTHELELGESIQEMQQSKQELEQSYEELETPTRV